MRPAIAIPYFAISFLAVAACFLWIGTSVDDDLEWEQIYKTPIYCLLIASGQLFVGVSVHITLSGSPIFFGRGTGKQLPEGARLRAAIIRLIPAAIGTAVILSGLIPLVFGDG